VSDKAVNSWVDAINDFRPSDTMTEGFNRSLPLHGLPPIWVPGATTASCVEEHGGEAKCPKNGVGSPAIYADMLEELVGDANQLRDEKILLVCGEGGGQKFDQRLGRATPKEIVYRTITRRFNIDDWGHILNGYGKIDYVWVTSASILNSLEELVGSMSNFLVYADTQIIVGCQRLEVLANELLTKRLKNCFNKTVITLPDPTNQQLLRYLEAANPTAKAPRKNNA
ncbi:MAG: hypothetical protein K0U41_03820, partial [Gammaproteobacteria bacterium]|nr:hypothetical protein [Gammaproteobacteria bacterium]